MRILGGSFGVPGTAQVTATDVLVIRTTNETSIYPKDIREMNAEVIVKFSLRNFLLIFGLTILIIQVAGTGFISWAVGIIGLVGSVAGSFRNKNVIELAISEHRSIVLECTSKDVQRIRDFKNLAK